MHSAARNRLYEGRQIRNVTGDAIRPGGFTLTDRALSFCSFAAGASILDVGCGVGVTVEHLIINHHLAAIGVDPSPVLLEYGRQRRPDLPLLEAAGENLPFNDGEMDGVFMECTLSVMENADCALAECYRVLKKGGRLVVADVYARNPEGVEGLRRLPFTSCLTGAMSRQELMEKIESNGFKVVLWEDHSRLLVELTARLIMANGSLGTFWGKSGCSPVNCRDIQETVKKAKLGYFLLITRKAAKLRP